MINEWMGWMIQYWHAMKCVPRYCVIEQQLEDMDHSRQPQIVTLYSTYMAYKHNIKADIKEL